jgi:hypothetical protein
MLIPSKYWEYHEYHMNIISRYIVYTCVHRVLIRYSIIPGIPSREDSSKMGRVSHGTHCAKRHHSCHPPINLVLQGRVKLWLVMTGWWLVVVANPKKCMSDLPIKAVWLLPKYGRHQIKQPRGLLIQGLHVHQKKLAHTCNMVNLW